MSGVRFGVHLGAWSREVGPEEQLALAVEAERCGFESVWVSENYGSDASAMLGWLAAKTSAIALGSGVFQLAARTPALTAMTAATLDVVSGGRFRLGLGLGLSGPQVVEGWHGQPFDRPLERLREYVEIVRSALRRERLTHGGDLCPLPRPGGEGKPLKLIVKPVQERIPISLGALGPRAVTLAAEIADGWMPILFWPERAEVFTESLERGRSRRAEELGTLSITPLVTATAGSDPATGRQLARRMMAFYVGGAGSREQNFYASLLRRYGCIEVADRVQDLYLKGDTAGAEAAIPDELVDRLALCGDAAQITRRLKEFEAVGVERILVDPLGATLDERVATVRALAALRR